jgi:transglutaminase-like putative cysteine protease
VIAASALVPGQGWIGYDPTNPIHTSDHHVRVAVGGRGPDARNMPGRAARETIEVTVTTMVL